MKSLKESLFDSDLVDKKITGVVQSMDDIKKLLVDPIVNKLGFKTYNLFNSEKKSRSIKTSLKTGDKFIVINSESYNNVFGVEKIEVLTLEFCFRPDQDTKNWTILSFNIKGSPETDESDESGQKKLYLCKFGHMDITTRERLMLSDGIIQLDGSYKTPKYIKNEIKNGVLTYDNIGKVKKYFEDLIESYYDIMDSNSELVKDVLNVEYDSDLRKLGLKWYKFNHKINSILK